MFRRNLLSSTVWMKWVFTRFEGFHDESARIFIESSNDKKNSTKNCHFLVFSGGVHVRYASLHARRPLKQFATSKSTKHTSKYYICAQ